MRNKILLISNRGVRSNRTGETLFKNKLTSSRHRLRCAEVSPGSKVNKYALKLIEKGQEQEFLNESVSNSNGRPWVFFLHGNSQTLHKNLKKCFELRELYDVNVLAFSWPSVHHGKIRGVLNYFPIQLNLGKYITRQLSRKLKQYGKARKNAKLSAKDFGDSLLMFNAAVSGKDINAHFVCHSLGHRVLKLSNDHYPLSSSLSPFTNILLHQADEDNDNHRDWIEPIGKGESVVITTHSKDKILKLSNIYNHKSLKNKRLGNVVKVGESQPPTYKDFTGLNNLNFSKHTMFLIPENKNPNVYLYFKNMLS